MKTISFVKCTFFIFLWFSISACSPQNVRLKENFGKSWKFQLGDNPEAKNPSFDDAKWRCISLPHDWSIEGEFSDKNPATPNGGGLPGGVGWYRKTFEIANSERDKEVFIDFDGIYRNSEVWINGHYLGIRPYGYSSFQYDLTPFLKYGTERNVIAVRVDNSKQPNSRWYSGSGIYRNVWLTVTGRIHIDHWGTCIRTKMDGEKNAKVQIQTRVSNMDKVSTNITLVTTVLDECGRKISQENKTMILEGNSTIELQNELNIPAPNLWSINKPYLYRAVSMVFKDGRLCDDYTTSFGIRTFEFDPEKGFFLNGKSIKIVGVCDHHDLGCLGAAINYRALQRQLEILKAMGINGIRTSHNPPAPELLDLCDKMGFIVMDEAFDMWKKSKTEFDYHLDWDQWHKRDLEDMVLRDRNHPSVFIWSIGNEILEQGDSTGLSIAKELAKIIRDLDVTRPITSACNNPFKWNFIIQSNALDLIGYNYHHEIFQDFMKTFPGKKFIATETTSALMTRGSYDMPSDSVRRWPVSWDKPFTDGNKNFTCSSYDNCSVPWGSTHEETWKVIKKYNFLSGLFIWTGFDYLGEPTPYPWPARSSYFGIVDLAGFPKDVYYLYQSELTDKPVLHLFPHWNWKVGEIIDMMAYSNCEEVELFLNGQSLGKRHKAGNELHFSWKVPFISGTLKAVGRIHGRDIIQKEIKTAGSAYKVLLSADRNCIESNGEDLSFITAEVVDKDGTEVPDADNLIRFKVKGAGILAGVDNGDQISHESFKADCRKAFHGKCLLVVKSNGTPGNIYIEALSDRLEKDQISIQTIK